MIMVVKYALIRGGKIIKFRNVPDDDELLIGKLLVHGYLIVTEGMIPPHDGVTQSLSERYEIQKDKVVRIWEIHEIPFTEARRMAEDLLKYKTLDRVGESLGLPQQEALIADIMSTRNQKAALIKAAKTNQNLRDITIEMI